MLERVAEDLVEGSKIPTSIWMRTFIQMMKIIKMVVVLKEKPRNRNSCRRKEHLLLSESRNNFSIKINRITTSAYQNRKLCKPLRKPRWIPNSRTSWKRWRIRSKNSTTTTVWWQGCSRKSPIDLVLVGVYLTFPRLMSWAREMIQEARLLVQANLTLWVSG